MKKDKTIRKAKKAMVERPKSAYHLVSFSDIANGISDILSEYNTEERFKIAIFLFSKLYGPGYYSTLSTLSSMPNDTEKFKKESIRKYNRYINNEEVFKNLQKFYFALDEDTKNKIRNFYKPLQEKIKTYIDDSPPRMNILRSLLAPHSKVSSFGTIKTD